MFRNTSRILIAVAIVGVVASLVGAQPAAASSKTGNFILGLAAGALLGAALNDRDDCRGGYYTPAPRYAPPPAYYYPQAPRPSYNEGYRDGYSDGTYSGGGGYYYYPAPRYAPQSGRYSPPRPHCR